MPFQVACVVNFNCLELLVLIYFKYVRVCVHIFSARLAAAAGTGDPCGQREDAKKDVITGRVPLRLQII